MIFRLGRVKKGARGPGLFFIIPCMDTIVKVDLRTVSFDVPPQEILTKDSGTESSFPPNCTLVLNLNALFAWDN